MSLVDADIVIAGAGASGLSLALMLHAKAPRLSLLLLEPREAHTHDRTFCFFRARPHRFSSLVSRTFHDIEVKSETREVIRTLREHPYEELRASDFYAHCLADLETNPRAKLERGVHVTSVEEQEGCVAVQTSRGPVHARLFIDARGGLLAAKKGAHDVNWLQHFVGQEVTTENPVFTPGRATLMDYRVSQAEGPHFIYVLPSSRTEALVEDTYFSPSQLPRSVYEDNIRAWLSARGAGEFAIGRQEEGAIPMSSGAVSEAIPRATRMLAIGQRGGAAKPSSGYAFQFIQRQCEALSTHIESHGVSRPLRWLPPRTHIATMFDRVFLGYLRRHPQEGPSLFTGLFKNTNPDALARFMSEEGGLRDHLAVMNAVPRRGVVSEIARSRHLWMRAR